MKIKKWFKKRPAWLQGGIIAGLIGLAIGLILGYPNITNHTLRYPIRAFVIDVIFFAIFGLLIGALSCWIINKWFKKKPYWLKGGIIGAITGLLVGLFILAFTSMTARVGSSKIPVALDYVYAYTVFGTVFAAGGFIIGAIIGWIWSKIKWKF